MMKSCYNVCESVRQFELLFNQNWTTICPGWLLLFLILCLDKINGVYGKINLMRFLGFDSDSKEGTTAQPSKQKKNFFMIFFGYLLNEKCFFAC